jgi:hypothetical protein
MTRLTKEQLIHCMKSQKDAYTEYTSELYCIRQKIHESSMDKQTKFEASQAINKQILGFKKIVSDMHVSQWGTNN